MVPFTVVVAAEFCDRQKLPLYGTGVSVGGVLPIRFGLQAEQFEAGSVVQFAEAWPKETDVTGAWMKTWMALLVAPLAAAVITAVCAVVPAAGGVQML